MLVLPVEGNSRRKVREWGMCGGGFGWGSSGVVVLPAGRAPFIHLCMSQPARFFFCPPSCHVMPGLALAHSRPHPRQVIVETVENFSRYKRARASLGMDAGAWAGGCAGGWAGGW